MEDTCIIDLLFARQERAVTELQRKYGGLCRRIAGNLLQTPQDTEECLNDLWYAVWRRIPPEKPAALSAYLGRIVRNLAVSRYRETHAQKRGGELAGLLAELRDCVPARETTEDVCERHALGAFLSGWLDGLPREDRVLFLRRYWYGERLAALAREQGMTPNQASQRLLRLRRSLKKALEAEGVSL